MKPGIGLVLNMIGKYGHISKIRNTNTDYLDYYFDIALLMREGLMFFIK